MKAIQLKSILLLALLTLNGLAFSQQMGGAPKRDRQEKKDNIESMKIAFLTNKLDLTPDEAQKFWPVYNQYQDKLHELRRARKTSEKDAKKKMEELSDKEIESAIDNDFALRQKELDLQKDYHTKFKTVLPVRKVSRLYAAEEQFKIVLLDKLKDTPRRD